MSEDLEKTPITTSLPTSVQTEPSPIPNQPSRTSSKKGKIFILLKILAVLIIIACLIFAGLAFNKSQQAKKRDAKRKADIALIKDALEKVRKDTEDQKYYPTALTSFILEQRGYISKI